MSISMFDASVPRFVHMLKNLDAILDKGEAYAQVKKLAPEVLPASRLFPDMFPLSRQIQIATDIAKGAVARLAGIDIPCFEDTEQTMDELKNPKIEDPSAAPKKSNSKKEENVNENINTGDEIDFNK